MAEILSILSLLCDCRISFFTDGAVYIRWGRTTCPSEASIIYSGRYQKPYHLFNIDRGVAIWISQNIWCTLININPTLGESWLDLNRFTISLDSRWHWTYVPTLLLPCCIGPCLSTYLPLPASLHSFLPPSLPPSIPVSLFASFSPSLPCSLLCSSLHALPPDCFPPSIPSSLPLVPASLLPSHWLPPSIHSSLPHCLISSLAQSIPHLLPPSDSFPTPCLLPSIHVSAVPVSTPVCLSASFTPCLHLSLPSSLPVSLLP